MAAFSESAWAIGMWATSSHAAMHGVGQAFALGADDQRHVAVDAARPAGTPSRATSATRRPGSSATSRTRATGHGEQRAHRGADGLVPVRVGAARAERDAAAPNASAERMTVPTLPGSPTPHSATHSGPTGADPALRVDADRARAGARAARSRPARAARPAIAVAARCPSAT